jgi:hypothetical protein
MADPTTPKIIVDDDWKSQARAEKEKLAAAEKQRAAEKQAAAPAGDPGDPGAGPGGHGGDERLPPANFDTLLGSMITQALMYMGAFPDPETGQAIVSLEHAKFHIDLLGVLETKTKGNLSDTESKGLNQALSQLRLQFVEVTKAVAAHMDKRRGGGPGGPGAGPGLKM